MLRDSLDIHKKLLKDDLSDISGSDNSPSNFDRKNSKFLNNPNSIQVTEKITEENRNVFGSRNSIKSKSGINNKTSHTKTTAKKNQLSRHHKQVKSSRPSSHFVENHKNSSFLVNPSYNNLQNDPNSGKKSRTKNSLVYSSRQVNKNNTKILPYGLERVINEKRSHANDRNYTSSIPRSNFANRIFNDLKVGSVDNKLDMSMTSFYYNNRKGLDELSHSDYRMIDNQNYLNTDKIPGSFRINTESNLGLKDDRLSVINSVRGINGSFNHEIGSKRRVPVNSSHHFEPYSINEDFWKISSNVINALEDFITSRDKDDYFAIFNVEDIEKHIKMMINEKIKLKNIIEYFEKFISKGRNALWKKRRVLNTKFQGVCGSTYQDSAMSRNFRALSSKNIVDNILNYEMNNDPQNLYNLIDTNPQSKNAIERILDGYCELNPNDEKKSEKDDQKDMESLNSKICKTSNIQTDLIDKKSQHLHKSVDEIGSNRNLNQKYSNLEKNLKKTSRTINDKSINKLDQNNKDLSNNKPQKSHRSSIDQHNFCQTKNDSKNTIDQDSQEGIIKSKSLQRRNSATPTRQIKKRGKILEKISPTNSKPGILKYMYKDDSQSFTDKDSIQNEKRDFVVKNQNEKQAFSTSNEKFSISSPYRSRDRNQILKESGTSLEKTHNSCIRKSLDKKNQLKIQVMVPNMNYSKKSTNRELQINIRNNNNPGNVSLNDTPQRNTFPECGAISSIQVQKASQTRRSQNKKSKNRKNNFMQTGISVPKKPVLTVQQKNSAINTKNENFYNKFDLSSIHTNDDLKKKVTLNNDSGNKPSVNRLPFRRKQTLNVQNFSRQLNDLEYELNCLEMKSRIQQQNTNFTKKE